MKSPLKSLLFVAALLSVSALAEPSAEATNAEKANAALKSVPERGQACRVIAVEAGPVAVSHAQDPNLQQTVGRARLSVFQKGQRPQQSEGVVLATIVGKQPTGELLGNHHLVFPNGTLRTVNDVIFMTPTSDQCVMNARVQINVQDGTGDFAGYSGSGTAEAQLNFCGSAGRAVIYARICR